MKKENPKFKLILETAQILHKYVQIRLKLISICKVMPLKE